MTKNVNHPSHYQCGTINNNGDSEYETIVVLERLGLAKNFCIGNAIKYISRAGRKNNICEDLQKSIWYLNRVNRYVYKRDEIMNFVTYVYLEDVCSKWVLPELLKMALRETVDLNFSSAISYIATYIDVITESKEFGD